MEENRQKIIIPPPFFFPLLTRFLPVIGAEVSCSDPFCVADAAGARQGDARTAQSRTAARVRDGDGRVWLRERGEREGREGDERRRQHMSVMRARYCNVSACL